MKVQKFIQHDDGATALEYGLLAALIAASIVLAVSNLGSSVNQTFEYLTSVMQNVVGGGS